MLVVCIFPWHFAVFIILLDIGETFFIDPSLFFNCIATAPAPVIPPSPDALDKELIRQVYSLFTKKVKKIKKCENEQILMKFTIFFKKINKNLTFFYFSKNHIFFDFMIFSRQVYSPKPSGFPKMIKIFP